MLEKFNSFVDTTCREYMLELWICWWPFGFNYLLYHVWCFTGMSIPMEWRLMLTVSTTIGALAFAVRLREDSRRGESERRMEIFTEEVYLQIKKLPPADENTSPELRALQSAAARAERWVPRKANPNEQFEVFVPHDSAYCSFEFNNLSTVLFFVVLVIGIGMAVYSGRIRSTYDYLLFSISRLVQSMVRENLYMAIQRFFTIILYLFLIVLVANLIGMIPYGFTVTGSFIFTFFLALSHFAAINLIASYKHSWNAFELFLPSGAPLGISPLLIIIEVVSYLARVFSLSIRLFANMMSGHALLKILISFCLSLLITGTAAMTLALIPWGLVALIFFLELLIAFLQAYVFGTLSTLYINDVLNLH